MFSNHMFGLLYDARREWREISREPEETITQVYVKHALLLAMIPPFALFTGTTQMGWSFAGQDLVFLSIGSAAAIAKNKNFFSISVNIFQQIGNFNQLMNDIFIRLNQV